MEAIQIKIVKKGDTINSTIASLVTKPKEEQTTSTASSYSYGYYSSGYTGSYSSGYYGYSANTGTNTGNRLVTEYTYNPALGVYTIYSRSGERSYTRVKPEYALTTHYYGARDPNNTTMVDRLNYNINRRIWNQQHPISQ